MKVKTCRGITVICDICGCQSYERTPKEEEKDIKNHEFWHCPHCGNDFMEYKSVLDDDE